MTMTQRNPARPVSNRGGAAIRYDVVWTLPFSEYRRIGYTETQTWWLDSIHITEVAGNRRFTAIAEAVKASNGSAVLFEVTVNPKVSRFSLRVIARAGRQYQPPPIGEVNPVTVDVDGAFKQLCAKWGAENNRINDVADKALPRSTNLRRRPKQKRGAILVFGTLAAGLVAVVTATFMNYALAPAAPSGSGLFGSWNGDKEAKVVTPQERPRQRVIIPLTDARSREANLCEFYTMSERADRVALYSKGTCP
jgi:hypothetical protein